MLKAKKQRLIGMMLAISIIAPCLATAANAKERPLLNIIRTQLAAQQAQQDGEEPPARGLEGLLNKTISTLQTIETKLITAKTAVKTKIEDWKNNRSSN